MAKKHIQSSPGANWRAQPVLCSRFYIGVCLSIAGTLVQAAPLDLSNESLDAITAENPGRSLTSYQSSQPAANSRDSDSPNDIVDGTGIVVDQSSTTKKFVNKVTLTDAAQQDVRAANIVNAVVSDSASGANVFSALGDSSSDKNDGFAASQSNLIEQTGSLHAEVGRYSVADGASTRTFNETRTEYSFGQKHSETQLIDRSGSTSRRDTEFHASVPAITLGDLVFEVEQPPTLPSIEIPLTGNDSNGNPYVKARLHSTKLELGDIVWSDENGIELQSARLTLPIFEIGITRYRKDKDGNRCCAYTDWTTIIDKPISLNIGKVTLLDIENPVDELGAVGFAAYGNGEIKTTAGKLSLSAEIDLRRILNTVVDLKKIGIPGTNINLDSLLGELLPVFDLGISADLDLFQGLARSFGSDVDEETYCFPADSATCKLIVSTTDTTNSENISIETSSSMESHSSGHNRSETFSQRGPVEVQDAKAKIVVLGASSAKGERYNVVLVAEGSQDGIRVLNGVNSSNSITGNGINIVADQAAARMPAHNGSIAYSQTNRIIQIGGL